MEGCSTFQWGGGGGCFSDEESSFLSGGMPHGWALVLMGGGFKKNRRMGGGVHPPCPPPPLWETLWYMALFTVSYFLSEILKLPDNGGKRNVEIFYFYDF